MKMNRRQGIKGMLASLAGLVFGRQVPAPAAEQSAYAAWCQETLDQVAVGYGLKQYVIPLSWEEAYRLCTTGVALFNERTGRYEFRHKEAIYSFALPAPLPR